MEYVKHIKTQAAYTLHILFQSSSSVRFRTKWNLFKQDKTLEASGGKKTDGKRVWFELEVFELAHLFTKNLRDPLTIFMLRFKSCSFVKSSLLRYISSNLLRTHTCGGLGLEQVGHTVRLSGWLQSTRDMGSGLLFAPIKDAFGITQTVINDAKLKDFVQRVPVESIVSVTGIVRKRPGSNANILMKTGEIEVLVNDFKVLNKCSNELPFLPSAKSERITDEVRLKYRYLDLRRSQLQDNIRKRAHLSQFIRNYLYDEGFIEVETPLLFKSTPEGAREFIVPTRRHPGSFYALPQSPQQYKQLLMAAGCDKYFQIAKCFRDEDIKSDRQPEFTQVDMEMSFIHQQDIMSLIEKLLKQIWKTFKEKELPEDFPQLSYQEAMEKFGSDKPDMRFGMEISNINLPDPQFKNHDIIDYFIVEDNDKISSKNYKRILQSLPLDQQKFLSVGRFSTDSSEVSHLFKGIPSSIEEKIRPGNILVCGRRSCYLTVFAEPQLSVDDFREGIISYNTDDSKFLWVHSFPLFEVGEDGRLISTHHPFTAPTSDCLKYLKTDPKRVIAQHYDIVLNGVEIGGGSIRVHDPSLQKEIFQDILHLSENESARFDHLINALSHGCPPHGGIALGFDRLVSLICNADSIRDVIAFPKTNSGNDLMVSSPSILSDKDIFEYHVKIIDEPVL